MLVRVSLGQAVGTSGQNLQEECNQTRGHEVDGLVDWVPGRSEEQEHWVEARLQLPVRLLSVHHVHGDDGQRADQESPVCPGVQGTLSEEGFRAHDTPDDRDGVEVSGLQGQPGRRRLDSSQRVGANVVDDQPHHSVVDEWAQDSAVDLADEQLALGDLHVEPKLVVGDQIQRLVEHLSAKDQTGKNGLGFSVEERAGNQLAEESHAHLDVCDAEQNPAREGECERGDCDDEEAPPREFETAPVHGAYGQASAAKQDDEVPPMRHPREGIHELHVRVGGMGFPVLPDVDDHLITVFAIPQNRKGNGAGGRGEPPKEVHCVRGRPIWRGIRIHRGLVQGVLRGHDAGDVVRRATVVKCRGRHGWEILASQGVCEVQNRIEEPTRENPPGHLLHARPEWRVERAQEGDIVPVQGKVEHAKPFIARAQNVGNPVAMPHITQ